MENKVYGYARVSTREQNEDRQMIALENYPMSRKQIYLDKLSGKDFNRPQYQKLLRKIRAGDTIVIKSIDRLGRDYEEIQNQWRKITKEKNVNIVVLDMPLLDTRSTGDNLREHSWQTWFYRFFLTLLKQSVKIFVSVKEKGLKQHECVV